MATIQSDQRFELQYCHNGVWLNRNSGSTDYFQVFNPNDLMFNTYQSAVHALHQMENIGMKRDDLRIVGVDFTNAN